MEDRRGLYSVLVGKPEGKVKVEDLGVGEDNTKMDLEEVGYGGMDWIDLAQDTDRLQAFVTAVMKLRVP